MGFHKAPLSRIKLIQWLLREQLPVRDSLQPALHWLRPVGGKGSSSEERESGDKTIKKKKQGRGNSETRFLTIY